MRYEEFLNTVNNAIKLIDKLDKMIQTQPDELRKVDYELSDYYHLIENNELNDAQSAIVVKRIHELRVARRGLLKEHEIENTYNTHKTKLIGNNTRQFLLAEICKIQKKIDSEYKNRVLDETTVNNILNTPKKRGVGRPKKQKMEV